MSPSRSLRSLAIFGIMACTLGVARASEPPRAHRIAIELTTERGYAPMSDWNDGIEQLEALAKSRGLPISGRSRSPDSFPLEATLQFWLQPGMALGLEMDNRFTRTQFDVNEAYGGLVPGNGDFETTANGHSEILELIGMYALRGGSGHVVPFFLAGAGYGWGDFDFFTPGSSVQQHGSGPAFSLGAGVEARRRHLMFELSGGYLEHRLNGLHGDINFYGPAPNGQQRFYFDSESQLRQFAAGRRVDLSGAYVRFGTGFAF